MNREIGDKIPDKPTLRQRLQSITDVFKKITLGNRETQPPPFNPREVCQLFVHIPNPSLETGELQDKAYHSRVTAEPRYEFNLKTHTIAEDIRDKYLNKLTEVVLFTEEDLIYYNEGPIYGTFRCKDCTDTVFGSRGKPLSGRPLQIARVEDPRDILFEILNNDTLLVKTKESPNGKVDILRIPGRLLHAMTIHGSFDTRNVLLVDRHYYIERDEETTPLDIQKFFK